MNAKKNTNNKVEILVAEDSPTQAEQLKHLLEARGYAVVVAPDGEEALAAARRRRPTLVISDIMMPKLDGYGLCKAIKSDDGLRDVPVMLITWLSDPDDVIRGLECGADNFIRKPYDERYLLSRIEYLLMNLDLRKSQRVKLGIEITLGGRRHFITSERQQILDLLISTYEQAVHLNRELAQREKELEHAARMLHGLYRVAEALNGAAGEQEVAELALERALELPGVQAGWISLREGESGFRLAAARGLPPALQAPGAMDGDCDCRRKLLSGELDSVANMLECERLRNARGDTQGLRAHASVPIWLGGETLGVMNLVGSDAGLFNDEDAKNLYAVGNQLGVALARARLHGDLERLVAERTAKLEAEIEVRKRVEREQARLVRIIDATPDFVATGTLDGSVLYVNQAGRRMLGLEPGQDLSALRVATGHPEWAQKLVLEQGVPHAIEHGTWSGETAFMRAEGQETPVSQVIIAHKGPGGAVEYLSTIARDITLRKAYEARIERLNRVYRVLSGINTAIVRIRNRQELFEEACRIAVDEGGLRMAWIGMLDRGTRRVTPAAVRGEDNGYLGGIDLTIDGAPGSCKLIASALRERHYAVSNDVEHDPDMSHLAREALARGYRSVIALPLIVEDEAIGALALYAGERHFFDADEIRLLCELAGDLSFALDYLAQEERLDYLAYYDSLTGTANRVLFADRCNQRLHAARETGRKCAAVLIDIERFAQINETFGRAVGDRVLRVSAERLTLAVGDAGSIGRVAGDQFAIVLDEVGDGAQVAQVLEQSVLPRLGEPLDIDSKTMQLSCRCGVALFPADGADAETLLGNAEAALKKAKRSAARYEFYAPELNAMVALKLGTELKLRRAVERSEFSLEYQPKIELATGRPSGMEALLRWSDPETGPVPPVRFIPVLEETGLIQDVGRWALEQALREASAWEAKGVRGLRVAVNVSPMQLRQRGFVRMVREAIGRSGAPAAKLELEVTESLLMEDLETNVRKLAEVREMDVTVAIDDFGTGYSSFSYLARLPVNAVKIDRAFIRNLSDSPEDVSIVSTIISLGHFLKLNVVAEGIETEEQAKLLRLLRCDEGQGYLYSRSVGGEAALRFLLGERS